MHTQALALATALTMALALAAEPANADQSRSFVSGLGNDANAPDCTRTAPCRTFQKAHDFTLANGEITVLDPGSYGAVQITKNISIINDGVGEAGLLVSGGGVGISVIAPGAAVTLRGITIKGIGFGGGTGIFVLAASAFNVENCTIRNLDGTGALLGLGILFAANTGALQVTNTIVTDNSNHGINVNPLSPVAANVTGILDRVGLYNNGQAGLALNGATATGGTVVVTVNDSVASNNGVSGSVGGFAAVSLGGKALASMVLNRSVSASSPGSGILISGAGAFAFVNQSLIANNASGWSGPANTIFSAGNNLLTLNAANDGPMPLLPLR
jgi:hypothetical protein